jgi:uncharacterized protein (TIGR03435 family)
MSELDDHDLLAQYARENSQTAFTALVSRYLNLVYSVALRKTSDAGAAEEITQAVFIILAKKAGGMSRRVVLSGWLYHTTRLTAANYVRSEIRRQKREQEAFMQIDDAETWRNIAPVLEDAMARLGAKDRDAVVLRFFENKSLREVGLAMGASEDAAKMRVNRALARLRKIFGKRGLTLSGAAIAGAVSAHSVQAAPVALAKTISTVAVAQGAAASGSTLALVKGGLKLMAWTKMQTAVVTTAVVLLAAGTASVTVKEIQVHHQMFAWEKANANTSDMYAAEAQVTIVPTRFPAADGSGGGDGGRGSIGISVPITSVIQAAYGKDKLRTVFDTDLPAGKYDYLAKLVGPRRPHENLPINPGWREALQGEIARQFGLQGRTEMRSTDVLILRPTPGGVRNFKESHHMPNGRAIEITLGGDMKFFEQAANTVIQGLEKRFKIPIVDQIGLTGSYDYSIEWNDPDPQHPNLDSSKTALRDQLGLELVPSNMPIEMLVVDKVRP